MAVIHIPARILAEAVCHGAQRFRRGRVGEHDAAGTKHITNGVNMRHRRAHARVRRNPASRVRRNSGFFKAEAVCTGRAPYGYQHFFGPHGFFRPGNSAGRRKGRCRQRRMHAVRAGGHIGERAAGFAGDTALFHLALQKGADIFIHRGQGQNTVLPFHKSYGCAERTVNTGHFTANNTAAHNDERRRHGFQPQGVITVQDMRVVYGQTGQFYRA